MFLQQLVNGVSIGLMYSLIAIGFSMVYGILKIVNFAHGSIFMVGAFLGLILKRAGLPYYLAFPLAAVLTACVGMAIERLAYRPIRGAADPPLSSAPAARLLYWTIQPRFSLELQLSPTASVSAALTLGPLPWPTSRSICC